MTDLVPDVPKMPSVPPRTRGFCCLLVGLLNTATMVVVLCCRFRTAAKQGEGVRWCPAPGCRWEWADTGTAMGCCRAISTYDTNPPSPGCKDRGEWQAS